MFWHRAIIKFFLQNKQTHLRNMNLDGGKYYTMEFGKRFHFLTIHIKKQQLIFSVNKLDLRNHYHKRYFSASLYLEIWQIKLQCGFNNYNVCLIFFWLSNVFFFSSLSPDEKSKILPCSNISTPSVQIQCTQNNEFSLQECYISESQMTYTFFNITCLQDFTESGENIYITELKIEIK